MPRRTQILLFILVLVAALAPQVDALFLQQPYSFPTTNDQPFYIQYARVDGALYQKPNVITNAAVDRTLLARETGSTVVTTAGSSSDVTGTAEITLPAPSAGLVFTYTAGTSQTAGNMKIKTDAGTTFIAGGITVSSTAGTGSTSFNCNGTSHVAVNLNGTTQGGVIGSSLTFQALTSTLWKVTGILTGSGTVVTPCATS